MDSSASSPEILRDASGQEESLDENYLKLLLLKSAELGHSKENQEKRNDTPWPSRTESKIQSSIGADLYRINNAECQKDSNLEFLTPKQLDFSLLASPPSIGNEGSLDLTNPQSCSRDVPPNTPNLSNLEEELTKKAKQQEHNLKKHFEKMHQHSNLERLVKKVRPKHLDFSLQSSPAGNNVSPNTPNLVNLENLAQKISPNLDLQQPITPSSDGTPSTANFTSSMTEKPHSSITHRLEKKLVLVPHQKDNDFKEVSQNIDFDLNGKAFIDKEKMENVQKSVKETVRVRINTHPYTRNQSVYDEGKLQNQGLEALKRLVPGLKPNSGEIEVCEMAVKYIEFIKSQVGPEIDKEFTH